MQDPQLPKSIWYHTDAQFLGFRIVRPLKTPSAEEMQVLEQRRREGQPGPKEGRGVIACSVGESAPSHPRSDAHQSTRTVSMGQSVLAVG